MVEEFHQDSEHEQKTLRLAGVASFLALCRETARGKACGASMEPESTDKGQISGIESRPAALLGSPGRFDVVNFPVF